MTEMPLKLHCICSDILTPLTALGVPFEIDDHKGPIIENRISSLDEVKSKTLIFARESQHLCAKCCKACVGAVTGAERF